MYVCIYIHICTYIYTYRGGGGDRQVTPSSADGASTSVKSRSLSSSPRASDLRRVQGLFLE